MPVRLARVVEGLTELSVPAESLTRREPETSPVFFNPVARLNRDVSVAITAATEGRTYADVLSGLGARGVRVANEVGRGVEVTLNDFNRTALRLARANARLNSVQGRCEFSHLEANEFLYSRFGRDRRFDYVDVDPFGTPVPYLRGALQASSDGAVLSVTATDSAVLCGVYPRVSRRRYGAASVRSSFSHETGLRVLLGFIARVAASGDVGIRPVAAHATRHYLRVYLRVARSAAWADESLSEAGGYVSECLACGECAVGGGPGCGRCGKAVQLSGPLWTGRLVDPVVLARAEEYAAKTGLAEAASDVLGRLRGVDEYPPYSYSVERVCSRLGVASVPLSVVARGLASVGHGSAVQPFEKRGGLKTTATYEELARAVREASEPVPETDEV